MEENVFKKLNSLDVNEFVEKKNGLSYLSWANAWKKVNERYNAKYTIWKDEENRPYIYDNDLGYMVFTTVTIESDTKEMWLPVMDGANKAQKNKSYTYNTRSGEKTCEAATMFDINTTIMRCLVKNLAMFGLGLYIYAGEDLPSEYDDNGESKKQAKLASKPVYKFGFGDSLEWANDKVVEEMIKAIPKHRDTVINRLLNYRWSKANKEKITNELNK